MKDHQSDFILRKLCVSLGQEIIELRDCYDGPQAELFWAWKASITGFGDILGQRSLVGWLARVVESYSELGCDHDVGICACNLQQLIQDAKEWEQGFCKLEDHGWVVLTDPETGELRGECMV